MKIFKILAIIFLVGVCISGCTAKNRLPDIEATDPGETTFELTSEEQKLYKAYAAKKDVNVFKDAPQTSIAKIFIQCGIDGDWEGEYNLYSSKNFSVSKEDYSSLNNEDVSKLDINSRKSMADLVFPLLKDGVVTETNDNECYVEYYDPYNEKNMQFYFYKNEDGIWLVDYKTFSQ